MQYKITNNVTAVTNPQSMSSYTLLNIGFKENQIQKLKSQPESANRNLFFVFNNDIMLTGSADNQHSVNWFAMHIDDQYFSNKTYSDGCKKLSKAFNLLLKNITDKLTEFECLQLKYMTNNLRGKDFGWLVTNFKHQQSFEPAPVKLCESMRKYLGYSTEVEDNLNNKDFTRLYKMSDYRHICMERARRESYCRFLGLDYIKTSLEDDNNFNYELSLDVIDNINGINQHCVVRANNNRLTPTSCDDSIFVCSDGYFEASIKTCHNCDAEYNTSIHNSESGRCHVCDESIENIGLRDAIHNYSYKPRAKFFYVDSSSEKIKSKLNPVTKLNAGFEVEIEARDNNLSGRDNRKMMQKTALTITQESNNFLYCKDDSSIGGNGGFEIVSHPATFNALRKMDLDNMFLKHRDKFKSFFTRSCGMHIHLSRSAFNDLQLYKFVLMLNEYKNFTHFVSQRRKYSEYESWCDFKSNFHNDVKSDASWKIRKQKSEVKQGYRNKLKFQSDLETGTRYQVVNLQNSKTIEIRCFKGNLDANGFRKNLDFVESMFYFCKDSSLQDLNIKNFVAYVRRDEKTYKHLNTFFKKNRLTLNKVLKNPLEIENN